MDSILTFLKDLDTTNFVALIVSLLTLVGVAINIIATRSLNAKTFKDEYYKKIIKKQFEAYLPIENVLKQLNLKIVGTKGEMYHKIFKSKDDFDKFFKDFNDMAVFNYLFSKNIVILNSLMTRRLSSIKYKLDENPNKIQSIGLANHQNIYEYFACLQYYFIKDLRQLHNVNRFLKKRTKDLFKVVIKFHGGRIKFIKSWLYLKYKEIFIKKKTPS